MNDRKIPTLLPAAGILLLAVGGSWLLLIGHPGRSAAIVIAASGWALVCFSQAARVLVKRR